MAAMPMANNSVFDQICFSGDSKCTVFKAHFLKPNMCTSCMKEIAKHTREAVSKEEYVLTALEHTQKGVKTPTLILQNEDGLGEVYLGGFKGAINDEFLRAFRITHILNVAGKGLGMIFGPKYRGIAQAIHEELNIKVLNLDWEDNMKFKITDQDFKQAIMFIEEGRKIGGIFVHCAQGKSRSGAAVCAYMMAKKNMKMLDSLEFIQERRKMIDPNPYFRMTLVKFESSEMLKQLVIDLNSINEC